MALTNEELIEELSNKPIMEVVDLVKALEEKWGVSAAAPVAVAAGPAADAGAVLRLLRRGGDLHGDLHGTCTCQTDLPRQTDLVSLLSRSRPGVRVRPALAHSGTLSQFHPLELTAAALTVLSAGIRCPDPGTTVSLAQDADLPAGHRVAHWGGGSGPARVGWGTRRS